MTNEHTPLSAFRTLTSWTLMTAAFRRSSDPDSLPGSMDDIASYHRRRPDAGLALSDRVWADLELDGVFRLADHCVSAPGQQVLYAFLRRPQLDPTDVARRDEVIQSLDSDPRAKDDVRRALSKLRTWAAYDLHRLFDDELPRRPRLFFVLPLITLASVVGILMLFVSPAAGLSILLIAICINIGVKVYLRPRFEHLIQPIIALRSLLLAAESLAQYTSPSLRACTQDLPFLCGRLRWIKGAARRLVIEDSGNELVASLATWANLLFLLDVNAFVFSIERLRRSREDLRAVFLTVGAVDAYRAVGAFRKTLVHWSTPQFHHPAQQLRCKGLYHPVVADPVLNDCRLNDRSLLIIGSNMAGKSTYLRAVGTGAVLAQTIATVPASSWASPVLRVETLITRGDDLAGGTSYFFAEAERVKEMLDIAVGPQRCLFLIDELYRGTNTAERIAAAHAVLDRLDSMRHLCLVATHDLELLDLLGSRWDTWHFTESVNREGVLFDYRLRAGVATTPNALRLLQRLDYPPAVVRRAYDTYRSLPKTDREPETEPA